MPEDIVRIKVQCENCGGTGIDDNLGCSCETCNGLGWYWHMVIGEKVE